MFDDSPSNSPRDINSLIREGYAVTPIDYLSQGWEIFKQNAGGFIGFLLICLVINLILTGPAAFASDPEEVSTAAATWRSLGNSISSIISGPLLAGFLIVAFKILKRQTTTFGDFFKGFQNGRFVPIFLTSLVTGLLIALSFFIPLLILVAIAFALTRGGLTAAFAAGGGSIDPTIAFLLFLGFLLGLIAAIYLAVAYTFALPLVVERRLGFWQAIETSRKVIAKRWFSFFGFMLLLFLVNLVGALLCGLGLLVTVPLSYCAIVAAYRHILGLNLSSEMAV